MSAAFLSFLRMICLVLHGAQLSGLVDPHIVTIGFPKAAAMCIAPPSQQTTRLLRLKAAISSRRLVVLHAAGFGFKEFLTISAFSSSPGWYTFFSLPGDHRSSIFAA